MSRCWRSAARGTAAGFAGTMAMSASLLLERLARRHDADFVGYVDYDSSPHVVIAASKVIGFSPSTDAGRRVLFIAVHWGYGSVVGAEYDLIRSRVDSDAAATALFLAVCQGMAWTLFPVLGGTPPPWRWRRDLLVSSVAQHALYAVVVAATDSRLQ